MPDRRTQLERLVAELQDDVTVLEEVAQKNERAHARIAAGADDELDWAALAYTIHNIYNALEAYFLRVSKFFENELDDNAWHRQLLWRMTLHIEGVRPRLMDRDLAREIDELRSFRHVFRNLYDNRLDPQRVRLVQARVQSVLSGFRAAHGEFVSRLRAIVEMIGA